MYNRPKGRMTMAQAALHVCKKSKQDISIVTSVLYSLSATGKIRESHSCRPHHTAQGKSTAVLGQEQLATTVQAMP